MGEEDEDWKRLEAADSDRRALGGCAGALLALGLSLILGFVLLAVLLLSV